MKRLLFICFCILLSAPSFCQKSHFTYDNYENEVRKFKPVQYEGVSDDRFSHASYIFRKIKSNLDEDEWDYLDYMNLYSLFVTLKEDKSVLRIAFKKFAECEGSDFYIINKAKELKVNLVPDLYKYYLKRCLARKADKKKSDFNIDEYINSNNLNGDLIRLLAKIKTDDSMFRNKDYTQHIKEQKELDRRNQHLIDSLYNRYGTYIGKSLAGEKFYLEMWAVIQHSNPQMMGRYLPVIQRAVQTDELDLIPLKMLIDRYYGLTYGYQVYGSQTGSGFKMADDKTRSEINSKYGIE